MNAIHPTLSIRGLSIDYATPYGPARAVCNVSLDMWRGEAVGLVGESGSGKTTLGLGIVQLLPATATIQRGTITYRRYISPDPNVAIEVEQELDVLKLKGSRLRQFRWKECALVFQSAFNAFNPALRISEQFQDTARAHGRLSGRVLIERAAHLLRLVQLDPDRVWRSFPHELSGGMRQRALIALGLLLEPQLLILDEPTAALDVLTQRVIIDVLKGLRKELNFSLFLISHDLLIAAELVDRLVTMYAGQIVETGDVRSVIENPHHPYTAGLIRAAPTLTSQKQEIASIPGSPPDLARMPSGCKFHPRCLLADDHCRRDEPVLEAISPKRQVACWYWSQASQY